MWTGKITGISDEEEENWLPSNKQNRRNIQQNRWQKNKSLVLHNKQRKLATQSDRPLAKQQLTRLLKKKMFCSLKPRKNSFVKINFVKTEKISYEKKSDNSGVFGHRRALKFMEKLWLIYEIAWNKWCTCC